PLRRPGPGEGRQRTGRHRNGRLRSLGAGRLQRTTIRCRACRPANRGWLCSRCSACPRIPRRHGHHGRPKRQHSRVRDPAHCAATAGPDHRRGTLSSRSNDRSPVMEWTVHELAERAGISGRTLRHYHRIGLLEPDRVGANGYRYYGPDAVARLQRILLLRDTGLPLADIAAVLDAPETPTAEVEALQAHLTQLAEDREAIDRRISAVEHTLQMRREGREPRMDVMLEGFNDRYEAEVIRRWGR